MNDAKDHGLAVWEVVTLIEKGRTVHLPLWGRIGLILVYSIMALTVHETYWSRLSKPGNNLWPSVSYTENTSAKSEFRSEVNAPFIKASPPPQKTEAL